ncbi:WW domain binding protein 1-like b [Osmerus mordax]|uniref:WW domain binding protein 1-like b n=1 Tax=Osmerus mordax TaxID=8014 RepID=UPI00350FF809
MRAALCLALKMGLFLHAIGAVTPTESTADGSLLHCEGVRNQSYVCESGHCCGESQCCSYYYELWWFWLVWALIFVLSCCCVCHHRRAKHRLQQQQRQHEINLIAYREAHNYTSVPFYFRFLPNYLLPDYDEVVNRPPTPPPPYSALHTSPSLAPSPLTPDQQDVCCPPSQSTAVPPASDPRWPSLDEPHPHPPITIGSYRQKPDDKPLAQAPQEGDSLSGGPQERLPSDGTAGPEKGEDCCKEPLLRDTGGTGGGTEDKERVSGSGGGGRRRRFTGDSGIEVCVCGRNGGGGFGGGGGSREDRELRELESLLSREEEEEEEEEEPRDFCDGCGHPAPTGDEEQAPGGPEAGPECGPSTAPPPPGAPPPVCLLLHTINEQEGLYHGNSTEPQG